MYVCVCVCVYVCVCVCVCLCGGWLRLLSNSLSKASHSSLWCTIITIDSNCIVFFFTEHRYLHSDPEHWPLGLGEDVFCSDRAGYAHCSGNAGNTRPTTSHKCNTQTPKLKSILPKKTPKENNANAPTKETKTTQKRRHKKQINIAISTFTRAETYAIPGPLSKSAHSHHIVILYGAHQQHTAHTHSVSH